jgi:hypothetical protein
MKAVQLVQSRNTHIGSIIGVTSQKNILFRRAGNNINMVNMEES